MRFWNATFLCVFVIAVSLIGTFVVNVKTTGSTDRNKTIRKSSQRYKNQAACTPKAVSHTLSFNAGTKTTTYRATVSCNPFNGIQNLCGYCGEIWIYKWINNQWSLVGHDEFDSNPSCGGQSSVGSTWNLTAFGSGDYYLAWTGKQGCLNDYPLWVDDLEVLIP